MSFQAWCPINDTGLQEWVRATVKHSGNFSVLFTRSICEVRVGLEERDLRKVGYNLLTEGFSIKQAIYRDSLRLAPHIGIAILNSVIRNYFNYRQI